METALHTELTFVDCLCYMLNSSFYLTLLYSEMATGFGILQAINRENDDYCNNMQLLSQYNEIVFGKQCM